MRLDALKGVIGEGLSCMLQMYSLFHGVKVNFQLYTMVAIFVGEVGGDRGSFQYEEGLTVILICSLPYFISLRIRYYFSSMIFPTADI